MVSYPNDGTRSFKGGRLRGKKVADNFALIKPASSLCNLSCRYCFYQDLDRRGACCRKIMSEDVLKEIVIRFASQAERSSTFMFQGGEPLLAGTGFFERYLSLRHELCSGRRGFTIHSLIQTSGVLIDDSFARIFAKGKFLVGVSLDGPKDLHDLNRVSKNGAGSYERVLAGIDRLKSFGVPFNILCVVTDASCSQARRIMNFFIERDFLHLQFIPALPSLDGTNYVSDENFALFLSGVFEIWYEQLVTFGRYISIRFIDDLFSMLKFGYSFSCDLQGRCGNQHVFESDGSMYPCDFYVEKSYKLGTVYDYDSCERIKEPLQSFLRRDKPLKKCEACRFWTLCRGGCKRSRLTTGESFLCKTWHLLFELHAAKIDFVLQNYL